MTYTQEKITYGMASLAASALSTVGAIISTGEARWLYVTFTSSIITSCFLALIFKRADESIRLVVGRSGFAMLGGVLGSKYLVHRYQLDFVDRDIVALAGVAAGMCAAFFILGYAVLQLANANSEKLVQKLFKKWLE